MSQPHHSAHKVGHGHHERRDSAQSVRGHQHATPSHSHHPPPPPPPHSSHKHSSSGQSAHHAHQHKQGSKSGHGGTHHPHHASTSHQHHHHTPSSHHGHGDGKKESLHDDSITSHNVETHDPEHPENKRDILYAEGEDEHSPKNKKYTYALISALWPLRAFLFILGINPILLFRKRFKPFKFKISWAHPMMTWYYFVMIFNTANYLIFVTGMIFYFAPAILPEEIYKEPIPVVYVEQLDSDTVNDFQKVPKDWSREEMRLNFAPLVGVFFSMTVAQVSSINIILNRDSFTRYMDFWIHSIETMRIHASTGARSKFTIELIFCLIQDFTYLALVFAPSYTDYVTGLADLLSYIYYRTFEAMNFEKLRFITNTHPSIFHKNSKVKHYYWYKLPGVVLLTSSYVMARAAIMHFLFYNRLLVNICKCWNQRLRNGLAFSNEEKKAHDKLDKDEQKVRLDLRHLLKDHFTITHLFKMTETLFSVPLLTYYFLQTVGLVLQIYHVTSLFDADKVYDDRAGNNTEWKLSIDKRLNSKGKRDFRAHVISETILTIFVTSLTFFYISVTTRTAAETYAEGMGGFQILRRNCYLGSCDTTQERNFVHTLIVSFAPNNPLQLTADGYLTLNLGLVTGVISVVVSYLIAIDTLKPTTGEFWNTGDYYNLCYPPTSRFKNDTLCRNILPITGEERIFLK